MRPRLTRLRARLALLLVVVLTASACGGGGDDAADGGAVDEGRDGGSAATTAAPATTTSSTASTTTTVAAAEGECGLHGGYPQPWPERPDYRVELDVDPGAGTIEGDARVRFVPPRPTDRLVFRLWANMPRVGRGGGRMEVDAASLDGEPADARYRDGGAGPGTPGTIYEVLGDLPADRPVEARLRFTLTLPGPVNERIARVGDSLRLGSVLPLLGWVRGEGWHTSPAVSNFSEAVASEVADFDVTVRGPDGFTVLATGEEVEPGRFVATAVRDWGASVGRFRVVEGSAQDGATRVVVGVAEGVGDDPQRILDDTVASLDDFASRYGPYPYPVLSVGVTPSLSGGIEFPQHLHVGAGTSRDHLIHEVAHMWFYALVGNDQYEHPWLDEGLTEYAENRFLGTIGRERAREIPASGRGRLGASHAHWQQHHAAFYRSVYVQGLQALAAFGDEAGDLDAVDCGLRRYVLEHAYEVARPDDLVAALEAQTGVDPRPVLERFGAP